MGLVKTILNRFYFQYYFYLQYFKNESFSKFYFNIAHFTVNLTLPEIKIIIHNTYYNYHNTKCFQLNFYYVNSKLKALIISWFICIYQFQKKLD